MNSPHKGQWRGALMFSLICVWINGWVNNREAGDLRRHRTHYDVIVMLTWFTIIISVAWSTIAGVVVLIIIAGTIETRIAFTLIYIWEQKEKNNTTIKTMTYRGLTNWGRDKMAAIFQSTVSNGFSWMKMYEFRLKFHWSLLPRIQLTIFQHWFRSWLGADQMTSYYLNQWWLVYWCIYASLGLNELKAMKMQVGIFSSLSDEHQIITWINYDYLSTWPWWRHQMETFSASLALCAGKSLGTSEFPAQKRHCNDY